MVKMSIEVEYHENGALIKLAEKIDITNSGELKKVIMSVYDQGYNSVILDFTGVNMIDSSGIGKLLLFQNKLKQRGGELKIINITSDNIRKMFSMIHLYKVINIENLS